MTLPRLGPKSVTFEQETSFEMFLMEQNILDWFPSPCVFRFTGLSSGSPGRGLQAPWRAPGWRAED